MDCFAVDHDGNDEVVGTFGRTADEIFDWLTIEWHDIKDPFDGGTEAQDGE